jgi:hypothetical protein
MYEGNVFFTFVANDISDDTAVTDVGFLRAGLDDARADCYTGSAVAVADSYRDGDAVPAPHLNSHRDACPRSLD